MSCSLARPDRAARSTDARQRPLLICSLARSRSQDPVFLTRSHDEKHVVLTRSSRQGRAIHRRSPTSPSNLFARAIALHRPCLAHSFARRKACRAHSLVQTGPRDPTDARELRNTGFVARRSRKHLRDPRPLSSSYGTEANKADGSWIVRAVAGAEAVKSYRCPGCSQIIRQGQPHVVAWPKTPGLTSTSGVEERRHWHNSCWQRRR